jgi:quercetin dioxygenase-like cupin family protein
MKNLILSFLSLGIASLSAEASFVYPHETIQQYSMHGNFQKGLATKAMGASQFEVWRSSIAVGSRTPRHIHETEEVFIILKGTILAVIGEKEVTCIAPATLICPANIPHQLINVGEEPTDQILVLGIDSKISDMSGKEMQLPWRE